MTTQFTAATDAILRAYLEPCLATAHIPAPSDVQDAEHRFAIAVKTAAQDISVQVDGVAAEHLKAALEPHGHAAGKSLVAVVRPEDVQVWESAREGAVSVVGGPLPALAPLFAERQAWIPHAVVRIDRAGADMTFVADSRDREDVSVDGSALHVTKVGAGGWSQRRFQQSAEEQWDNNVDVVVERLMAELDETGIDLVLVTGDDRMTNLFTEALRTSRPDLDGSIIDIDAGSRAEDGSHDAIQAAADVAVREEATRRRRQSMGVITDHVGRGSGVTGRDAVLTALFEGRVDELLIHMPSTDGLIAHIGPEPIQVAADSSTLHTLDLDAMRVPLIDAALRGAAATGASVVMVEEAMDDITDGLAASLRG